MLIAQSAVVLREFSNSINMAPETSSALPPWKTMSSILERVAQLAPHDPSRTFVPLRPRGGRTFFCLPQPIRFKIHRQLLSSASPIIRPWPRKKFTVQLLRVSKDVFAEAAYCFYGKVSLFSLEQTFRYLQKLTNSCDGRATKGLTSMMISRCT